MRETKSPLRAGRLLQPPAADNTDLETPKRKSKKGTVAAGSRKAMSLFDPPVDWWGVGGGGGG
jgi:hypothetical protein